MAAGVTPIYGVYASFTIVEVFRGKPFQLVTSPLRAFSGITAFLLITGIGVPLVVQPSVGASQLELLEFGKGIAKINAQIFNHFDSGGWLELGIYLDNPVSQAKPIIDGRTLVMGKERLVDYFAVVSKKMPLDAFISKYSASYVIAKKNTRLGNVIFERPELFKEQYQSENLQLLQVK